jgi:hypothetical protein
MYLLDRSTGAARGRNSFSHSPVFVQGLWAWDVHWKIAEKLGFVAPLIRSTGEFVVDEHYDITIDPIRDAAQLIREEEHKPVDQDDTTELVRRAWTIHKSAPEFLSAALRFPTTADDYLAFIASEREKHGKEAVPQAAAWFLERLADRLATADHINPEVDHTFVLPKTFEQFREADNWPKHQRPS